VRDRAGSARLGEPLRYLIAGGWNTLFGYSTFAALYWLLSPRVHYAAIMIASTVVNVTMAYLSYKLFVFRTKGNWLREYARFYAVYAVPIGLGFVLLPFLIEVFRMNAYLAQALVVGITVVISYFGHKHVSFRARG
jgi:putative flippase GtrA